MKPDWKDAPEWARYLAMDSDGSWWWYKLRPNCDDPWFWNSAGKAESIKISGWQNTLEERPKPKPRYVCQYDPHCIECWKVTDTFVDPIGYPTTVASFSEQLQAGAVAKALNELEAK